METDFELEEVLDDPSDAIVVRFDFELFDLVRAILMKSHCFCKLLFRATRFKFFEVSLSGTVLDPDVCRPPSSELSFSDEDKCFSRSCPDGRDAATALRLGELND